MQNFIEDQHKKMDATIKELQEKVIELGQNDGKGIDDHLKPYMLLADFEQYKRQIEEHQHNLSHETNDEVCMLQQQMRKVEENLLEEIKSGEMRLKREANRYTDN